MKKGIEKKEKWNELKYLCLVIPIFLYLTKNYYACILLCCAYLITIVVAIISGFVLIKKDSQKMKQIINQNNKN
jgi:hypothetical protein